MFRELQTSLRRSRARTSTSGFGAAAPSRKPASTPASPSSAPAATQKAAEKEAAEESPQADAEPSTVPVDPEASDVGLGFFEDELRGFRLLKAAGLTNDQRMQVLTLTSNAVAFEKVRQALRALFDDSDPGSRGNRRKNLWFAEDAEEEDACWQSGLDSGWGWYDQGWEDEQAYWSEWPWEESWDHYPEELMEAAADEAAADDPDGEEEAAMVQEQEASALAAEAARTLQEARLAVQKVRAARGYYPLKGKGGKKGASVSSGKGAKGGYKAGASKSKHKWGSSKSSGKGGGCLICGRSGHFFRDCPQKGFGKKAGMYAEPVFHMYFGLTVAPESDMLESEMACLTEPDPVEQPLEPILRTNMAVEAGVPDELPFLEPDVFTNDTILRTKKDLEALSLDELSVLDPVLPLDGTILPTTNTTKELGKEMASGDSMEQALVMSLDTAFVTMTNGEPGFILDTGATENAVGVKTLQAIISKSGLKHKVSQEDRPVFRFGDGLSLRACSKVTLYGTALGQVDFYVLDGDHRPQTHNAENTPALLGSRFLRRARGTISYERLCLWFRDFGNTLWATELIQTQSGHLMIPASGHLLDLSSYRTRAEEEHGVKLPLSAASLMDVLSTPGALEELKSTQERSAETRVQLESVQLFNREPFGEVHPDSPSAHECHDLLFFDCLPVCLDDMDLSFVGAQLPAEASQIQFVRPQLCQRLRDLGARLSLHRLLWSNGGARASSCERSSAGRVPMLRQALPERLPTEPIWEMDYVPDVRAEDVIRDQARPREGSVRRGHLCCGARSDGGAGGRVPDWSGERADLQWQDQRGAGPANGQQREDCPGHQDGEEVWRGATPGLDDAVDAANDNNKDQRHDPKASGESTSATDTANLRSSQGQQDKGESHFKHGSPAAGPHLGGRKGRVPGPWWTGRSCARHG